MNRLKILVGFIFGFWLAKAISDVLAHKHRASSATSILNRRITRLLEASFEEEEADFALYCALGRALKPEAQRLLRERRRRNGAPCFPCSQ